MSKKEDTKLKVWRGKNMLKCNDCSCDNIKCEDGGRFCSRCGVWRIVLALALFIIMFKIGYITGSTMSTADSVDEMNMWNMRGAWNKNHKKAATETKLVSVAGTDKNGCMSVDAATWSKSVMKCVKLYQDAVALRNVSTGAMSVSYLIVDNAAKYELYLNGKEDSLLLNSKDGMWSSDDGMTVIKKNANKKYELYVSGKLIGLER